MNTIRAVCVYCGSSPGIGKAYTEAGRILGRSLAESGLRLVYGGGSRGVMGAVADGGRAAGGQVTGIIPRFLLKREANEEDLRRLDETLVVDTMHERKHLMFERADAFVALPGGIGTLEEIVEIMTWGQLGRHRKPIVFGNVEGFWEPVLSLLDHMREQGFVHSEHLVKPLVADRPEAIVPAILAAAAANESPDEGMPSVIERM